MVCECMESHDQVVEKLTTGFGAMLEQVQELARRNINLEQRLARMREEYPIVTEDHESPAYDSPGWLRTDREGIVEHNSDPTRHRLGSQSSDEDAIWCMGATGQDNAMAIAGGVHAWKELTNGKGPLWRKFNREQMSRQPSKETAKSGSQDQNLLPGDHAQVEQDRPEKVDCPFNALADLGQPEADESQDQDALQGNHAQEEQDCPEKIDCPFNALANLGQPEGDEAKASETQRPQPLPTPPPGQEHYAKISADRQPQNTPSVSGSASRCPIRMLDERSPEEVAEYFETHKHEVPRSHAICVKRYQSNAQSIRQLDAKYGNLTNMIQGLGSKHQPLLPRQEEAGAFDEMNRKSAEKVEKWAGNVEETSGEAQAKHRHSLPDMEERRGHFDRSLKEIRVGESPSRPWGIPMLGATPLKGNVGSEGSAMLKETESKDDQDASHSQSRKKQIPSEERGYQQKDFKSGIVFTGPVFIGYTAEQAAALLQKCGWDPNGPSK